MWLLASFSLPRDACKCRFKHLKTNFRCMRIWRKARYHLFVWMDVIPEVPKPMTKLLHVRLQQSGLAGDIYKLCEASFVKALHAAVHGLRAG